MVVRDVAPREPAADYPREEEGLERNKNPKVFGVEGEREKGKSGRIWVFTF